MVQRVAVVASVIGVSLLGNLRLHASEVRQASAEDKAQESRGSQVRTSPAGPVRVAMAAPVDDASEADAAADTGHFVPAIYAWDPDVRFVYYRHVSKWM